jgi:hypothetical protein
MVLSGIHPWLHDKAFGVAETGICEKIRKAEESLAETGK